MRPMAVVQFGFAISFFPLTAACQPASQWVEVVRWVDRSAPWPKQSVVSPIHAHTGAIDSFISSPFNVPARLMVRLTGRKGAGRTHLVDLRHDQGHVGVEAEGRGVVDHHGAVLPC